MFQRLMVAACALAVIPLASYAGGGSIVSYPTAPAGQQTSSGLCTTESSSVVGPDGAQIPTCSVNYIHPTESGSLPYLSGSIADTEQHGHGKKGQGVIYEVAPTIKTQKKTFVVKKEPIKAQPIIKKTYEKRYQVTQACQHTTYACPQPVYYLVQSRPRPAPQQQPVIVNVNAAPPAPPAPLNLGGTGGGVGTGIYTSPPGGGNFSNASSGFGSVLNHPAAAFAYRQDPSININNDNSRDYYYDEHNYYPEPQRCTSGGCGNANHRPGNNGSCTSGRCGNANHRPGNNGSCTSGRCG